MIEKKLSPSLRTEIDTLAAEQHAGREIDILIRTSGMIDQAQRKEIENTGCEIRSIYGDILTARAPAGNIRDVAGLDFVRFIDRAKKVYPK